MLRIKRGFDVVVAATMLVMLAPILILLAILIRLTSEGPALHWSMRVGKGNGMFEMPKFRSMRMDAPQLPSHLFVKPELYLTPIGSFIRRTSLDEIPQLFSVLKGQMSMVGPRPALYSQIDLITARTEKGIHLLHPGLTGWAQVNGRDELSVSDKVDFDYEYLKRQSFKLDMEIVGMTVARVLQRKNVSH